MIPCDTLILIAALGGIAFGLARLMNRAFKLGMDAKAAEVKAALGLGNA